jgi:electron transfer flavoprotein alpha subunit
MPAILAIAEQRSGSLRKVSQEAVAAARGIADAMGATVDVLVLGGDTVTGTEVLGPAGADRVLNARHADFALYQPDGYSATIA